MLKKEKAILSDTVHILLCSDAAQAMLTSSWRAKQGWRKGLTPPHREPGGFLLELV